MSKHLYDIINLIDNSSDIIITFNGDPIQSITGRAHGKSQFIKEWMDKDTSHNENYRPAWWRHEKANELYGRNKPRYFTFGW